jgi:hypothetical protein
MAKARNLSSDTPRPKLDYDRDFAKFTPRQLEAVHQLDSGKIKFLLYGGALGGGKSYFLRYLAPRFLIKMFEKKGIKHVPIMLACEDYPSLKDRQLAKIATEFPPWLGKNHSDHKDYGRSFVLHEDFGSGVVCFRNLDDASKYASAEFAAILVDELTKNHYETFTHLRTRLRYPGFEDIECPFVAGTNPGGVGHGFCKQFWIDKIFPPEFQYPIDYRELFGYVPSKAEDNPHLDPAYWNMLFTLPEHLRKPFREGDWTIFVGQMFNLSKYHIINPMPVPDWAQIYFTFDWGFGAPFSCGWWWTDTEGRVFRFAEWYGWNGTPNTGLRLSDPEIAKGIIDKEKSMGLKNRDRIVRLAGPDCFSKKPNYMGGGQGPATAEIFAENGLLLSPGDAKRELKIRQFQSRLAIPTDPVTKMPNGIPMMQIYSTCEQFLRTIPNLINDKHNIEDIDTTGEDHVYDEACHIAMARPMAIKMPPRKELSMFEKDLMIIRGEDPHQYEPESSSGAGKVFSEDSYSIMS